MSIGTNNKARTESVTSATHGILLLELNIHARSVEVPPAREKKSSRREMVNRLRAAVRDKTL